MELRFMTLRCICILVNRYLGKIILFYCLSQEKKKSTWRCKSMKCHCMLTGLASRPRCCLVCCYKTPSKSRNYCFKSWKSITRQKHSSTVETFIFMTVCAVISCEHIIFNVYFSHVSWKKKYFHLSFYSLNHAFCLLMQLNMIEMHTTFFLI